MPLHAIVDRSSTALERVAKVHVTTPAATEAATIWRTESHGVPVYLVEHDEYFGRPAVYGHKDDNDRFLFFCDALLAAASKLDFAPDVIHAQDWHTALLLTRLEAGEHSWSRCGRVYTIHNLALRGDFTRAWAKRQGISAAQLAPPDALPREIPMSCMAQGILRADRVNTVSDTYAKEILTRKYGAGLDRLLRARSAIVSGIVNGIDYDEFDPATDGALTRSFTADTLADRGENKRALQREAGLSEQASTPLFGVVTRLFAQKGIDLVARAFPSLLASHDAQLVVLGTGDAKVHTMLQRLEKKFPDKVKVWLNFNPTLGQRIYAGCDSFLMPSRYEPCGLGQLISLRYGAVPLVRRTGGLADTVEDASADLRTGTGFVFESATAPALAKAVERAINAFADRKSWRAMQQRGMRQDWSWQRAAPQYEQLYESALAARTEAVA
jgi:starch synthase